MCLAHLLNSIMLLVLAMFLKHNFHCSLLALLIVDEILYHILFP